MSTEYQIVAFNRDVGQLIIKVEGFAKFAIDVPVVDGNYISGERLDQHIRGFLPTGEIQRRTQIASGVANADEIAALVVPEMETEEPAKITMQDIRHTRNRLLTYSDWTRLDDAQISQETKDAYAAYRQQLRDLPQSFENPEEIVFPDPPSLGESH